MFYAIRIDMVIYATSYTIRTRYITQETKKKIRMRRKEYGWSHTELNIRCLFTPTTIYKIETGMIVPSIYQLTRLNTVLQLNLQYC
jgi:ribosome-binding protein aMBF1 (putative translation factor)